jgi:hypothetical protein
MQKELRVSTVRFKENEEEAAAGAYNFNKYVCLIVVCN